MTSSSATTTADRHALVMALWLPAGLVASAAYHYGLGRGGPVFLLAAFGVVAAAFVGHVITNVVLQTDFTGRELALGLVLYVLALLAFGIAVLLDRDFPPGRAMATALGFLLVFLGFVFYMVTRHGARRAFQSFDVVRTFQASREDRGGAPQ